MAMSQNPGILGTLKPMVQLESFQPEKLWHKSHFRQGVKIDQYLRPEAHLGSLGLGAQLWLGPAIKIKAGGDAFQKHWKSHDSYNFHEYMSLMNHS